MCAFILARWPIFVCRHLTVQYDWTWYWSSSGCNDRSERGNHFVWQFTSLNGNQGLGEFNNVCYLVAVLIESNQLLGLESKLLCNIIRWFIQSLPEHTCCITTSWTFFRCLACFENFPWRRVCSWRASPRAIGAVGCLVTCVCAVSWLLRGTLLIGVLSRFAASDGMKLTSRPSRTPLPQNTMN